MATTTPNYGLIKPGDQEYYDVDAFNANVDKIDTAMKANSDSAQMADASLNDIALIGKNKFDKTRRTIGYWVNYLDGQLVESSPYDSSPYIPVTGGTTYYLTKFRNYALYDANKVYLSGYNNTSYTGSTVTPSQNGYIRFATGTPYIETTQMEIGSLPTTYEKYKLTPNKLMVQNSGIENETITEDKINPNSKIIVKRPGKNLINLSTIQDGKYVVYTTGNIATLASTSVTDFIQVESGTTYTLSVNDVNANTPLEQMAFYDVNKNYVSGLSNSGTVKAVTFTTPATAKFARLTINNMHKDFYQLEKGSAKTSFEAFDESIKVSDLEKGKISFAHLDPLVNEQLLARKIITVKLDGTGDFISLRSALESITDASEINQYEVQIYPGTHDIMSYYSVAEIDNASFIGLVKPNFVSLKGIGERGSIWLKGDLADGAHNSTTMGRVSTLVYYGQGTIENLKITARNLRYAVHDDYSFPGTTGRIKNCDFYKYKSAVFTGYPSPYGAGVFSDMVREYENCYFYTDQATQSFSVHNNVSFAKPSRHSFVNCEFDNKGSTTGIAFLSMGSGQRDEVTMVGCRIKGKIKFTENIAGVGCDFDLNGYANDVVPYEFAVTNGGQYTYSFRGEHLKVHNSGEAIIAKGKPVKWVQESNNSGVRPLAPTDVQTLMVGVTCQDISPGGSGIIRVAGYLKISDTPLTGLSDGDKIGIVNGELSKVTTGDYIGVVAWSEWIKFI